MKVDVMKIRQMSPESFALYLRKNDFHTFRFDTAEQTTPTMHAYSLNEIYTDAAITNDSGYSLTISRQDLNGKKKQMKILGVKSVRIRDYLLYVEAEICSEHTVGDFTFRSYTYLAIC